MGLTGKIMTAVCSMAVRVPSCQRAVLQEFCALNTSACIFGGISLDYFKHTD